MNRTWMMADKAFAEAWDQCSKYTMTSPERGYALWTAIEHVARDNRQGSLVECGCWRGGSAILIKLAAQQFGLADRPLYLFDTFSGMTAPQGVDVDFMDRPASTMLEAAQEKKETADIWAYASLEEVQQNFSAVGLDVSTVTFVKGDVAETVPKTDTGTIALLRLDTDFYDSTKVELECLYPQLCSGGVLLIDDYGHWKGAKRAVDEYFEGFTGRRPFLAAVDYTGRIGIKP